MPGGPSSLLALQDLARSFGERRSVSRERELCDLAGSLGTTALPLALRELRGRVADRRAWASRLLQRIAVAHRDRVLHDLHRLGADPLPCDDAKVAAISLLGELGERVSATASVTSFRDPGEIQRRSLSELAELLTNAPDVALAAELLITQLEPDALLDFVDGLAQAQPARTRHLVDELLGRTELDAGLRSELRHVTAALALVSPAPLVEPPRGKPRIVALRHPSGRRVVIVGRRDPCAAGAPRWRLLCLLIDADGVLAEAIHRDGRDDDGAALTAAIADELVTPLVADGFAQEAARPATIRTRVAEAARRTASRGGELPGAYFLGRDLLELGGEHRAPSSVDPTTVMLGRAVELLSAAEPERARPLFAHVVAASPDDDEALAGLGLCLLAAGELDAARAHLERACAAAPTWPLHAWNLAAIAHRQGRGAARYLALRRFVALAETSADDAGRVELARKLIAEHEREVRLDHPGQDAVRLAESAERPLETRRSRRRATRPPKVSARPRRSAPPPSPARP